MEYKEYRLMAIKTTNAEKMNKAILEKVERILDNIEYGRSVRIVITAEMGSLPDVDYRVTELINWDSEDND